MGSANERRRYIVTSSFIGWAHPQNGMCTDLNLIIHSMSCLIVDWLGVYFELEPTVGFPSQRASSKDSVSMLLQNDNGSWLLHSVMDLISAQFYLQCCFSQMLILYFVASGNLKVTAPHASQSYYVNITSWFEQQPSAPQYNSINQHKLFTNWVTKVTLAQLCCYQVPFLQNIYGIIIQSRWFYILF